jgi:RNA-directed DNA polymerase
MKQKPEQPELVSQGSGETDADAGSAETQPLNTERASPGTGELMALVCERGNLNAAWRKVVRMPVSMRCALKNCPPTCVREHGKRLREELLAGRYTPQPIKHMMIPKPEGGQRMLGIPTVIDRFVQQAILQALQPIFDATFSDHSYGFRPGRSAHGAIRQAQAYVQEGQCWVVDLDLSKFFDRVNDDILMGRLAKRIEDKHLLRLIRRYLQAGMLADGVVHSREEGTPQGGPLRPLLANVLLDEVDRQLEQRGHAFVRYADGGTHCDTGADFTARLQRVIVTAKCQGLRLVDWLTAVFEALWAPMPLPMLLPRTSG